MTKYITKLLVPVDFRVNTEVAIKKAIEIADHDAVIHLLHVQSYSVPGLSSAAFRYLMQPDLLKDREHAQRQLEEWKFAIEECREDVRVALDIVLTDSTQQAILRKARDTEADLIIVGKSSCHSWFPFLNKVRPGLLARQTGAAVLTVKPGSVWHKVKRVVIPVTNPTLQNKVKAVSTLCKKFKIEVHLVDFRDTDQHMPPSAAQALYLWIRETLKCPVEVVHLHGSNKAKAILGYARRVDADLLLLHPDKETFIGRFNKNIADELPSSSKMQIWTVNPAPVF